MRGQSKIVVTYATPGLGAALFPPGSSPGFVPLEKAPDVVIFLIMVQSLSLCLIGYEWCR
jgi:hypothetical protein